MVIYNQQMAAFLMLKGFVLQAMDKNLNGSGKNVFYFKDSDELKNMMKKFNEFKDQFADCLKR